MTTSSKTSELGLHHHFVHGSTCRIRWDNVPSSYTNLRLLFLNPRFSLHDSANRGTSGYMGTILREDDPKFVGVLAMG